MKRRVRLRSLAMATIGRLIFTRGKGPGAGGEARSIPVSLVLVAICLALFSCPANGGGGEEVQKEKAAKTKAARIEETSSEGVKAPPPPGLAIKEAEAQAVDPKGKEPLEDAITCLARTIYWEARSSTEADMRAIAYVVMNRVGHEGFPDTVCGVVKEGREKGACQFSWWCDGQPDTAQDQESYAVAKEVARKTLNRELKDETGGALYFHGKGSKPPWSQKYIRTAAIGRHVFYKPDGGKAK